MNKLQNAQIAHALQPYFDATGLESHFFDQIRNYIDLLLRWNRRMSLTTITDPLEILRLHFGESLFAIPSVPIRHGRLADVGTGAGFPAVPIRMAFDALSLTLIESNRKKRVFLAEVARELALKNVQIPSGRMEDLRDACLELDFVTARAVAINDAFLAWASASLKPAGSLILWLGHHDSLEISLSKRFAWREPIKIPNSDRRVILVGANSAASA